MKKPIEKNESFELESVHNSRIQLILAEKRTSLSVLRTGIAVFTLPLSVLTVLIATSRYYDFLHIYPLVIPVLLLCGGLIALAIYLIYRSVVHLWKHEALIEKLKESDPHLSTLYEEEKEL